MKKFILSAVVVMLIFLVGCVGKSNNTADSTSSETTAIDTTATDTIAVVASADSTVVVVE